MKTADGLWESEELLEQNIAKLKYKYEKVAAVKTQINLRKKIINQSAEKDLFKVSLPLDQLIQNLKRLIALSANSAIT